MSDEALALLLAKALLATSDYATVPGQMKAEHERLFGEVARSMPEVWRVLEHVGEDPQRWELILARVRDELRVAAARRSFSIPGPEPTRAAPVP